MRDESLALFDRATAIAPTDIAARYEKATVFLHEGDHGGCLELLRGLLRDWPGEERAHLMAARVLHIAGRHPEADAHLDRIGDEGAFGREARILREFGLYQEEFPRERALGLARSVEGSAAHLPVDRVAERIAGALRERRGFSLVRAGDGEGAFVTLGAEDEARFPALYAQNRRDRARVWFADAVDPNADPWLSEATRVTQVLAEADIVGLPYPGWLEHEYRIASITGITALTNALRAPREFGAATCSQLVHIDLHTSGLLYDLMRGERRIGLISCQRALPSLLREAFGFEEVEYHHVPGEKGHGHLLSRAAVEGTHWPDRYREIMAALASRRLDGMLFLVAAGILGKLYCSQIRRSGGVAIDIGSIADGWAGASTRPGLSRLAIPGAGRTRPDTDGRGDDPPIDTRLVRLVRDILENGRHLILDGSFDREIGAYVDQETTRIRAPEAILADLHHPDRRALLDFGCGTADLRGMIEGFGYDWRGVNHVDGMAAEVRDRARADPRIDFYDGRRLPYRDRSFDVVYSFQVFEHVSDPHASFAEIARVLKPGGSLVGAVSYLEQIHDYSIFNFTPYGLKHAAQRAGLDLIRLYPSYDVYTWMARRLLVVTTGSDDTPLSPMLTRENAIHEEFLNYGARLGLSPRQINLIRLMFSAHMSFHIVKPQPAAGAKRRGGLGRLGRRLGRWARRRLGGGGGGGGGG
ncbi:methyltransferase domain-containing protein, partial [Methylobacterium oryzisoli]|uniref:methyltransferase domain-containing protein n=1 Tax=Methylobacterium oryzisoli TaxID=3385502 RepID=UPI00397D591D